MNNIILVPTDFSEVCTDAIHYGAQLAKKLNASLAIVHIMNKESISKLNNPKLPEIEVQKNLSEISLQVKSNYGITVDSIFREGSIYTTISEISVEIGAKLLVLGTHGKVGVQQQLTGSFAHKVVTSSNVPVIIMQEGVSFDEGIKRIVFPVNSASNVRQKVSWAVQIAKIFDAKIYLFKFPESVKEIRMEMNVVMNQITDEFDKNSVQYEIHEAEKGGSFSNQVLLFA